MLASFELISAMQSTSLIQVYNFIQLSPEISKFCNVIILKTKHLQGLLLSESIHFIYYIYILFIYYIYILLLLLLTYMQKSIRLFFQNCFLSFIYIIVYSLILHFHRLISKLSSNKHLTSIHLAAPANTFRQKQ